MPTIEEIRARFTGDRFATEVMGIEIQEAGPGRAVCRMTLKPEFVNANNAPMGGALFSLADFAFAVAANGHADRVTVSQHASATFLAPAKGKTLTAVASCLKAGRRTCLYVVDIRDDAGTFVLHMTVNGFTVDPPKETGK